MSELSTMLSESVTRLFESYKWSDRILTLFFGDASTIIIKAENHFVIMNLK